MQYFQTSLPDQCPSHTCPPDPSCRPNHDPFPTCLAQLFKLLHAAQHRSAGRGTVGVQRAHPVEVGEDGPTQHPESGEGGRVRIRRWSLVWVRSQVQGGEECTECRVHRLTESATEGITEYGLPWMVHASCWLALTVFEVLYHQHLIDPWSS